MIHNHVENCSEVLKGLAYWTSSKKITAREGKRVLKRGRLLNKRVMGKAIKERVSLKRRWQEKGEKLQTSKIIF